MAEPLKCPDCGSTNIFYDYRVKEYSCLSCGRKWLREKAIEKKVAEELTEYGKEKLPLILDKLRAMQKITGMVREEDLYYAVRTAVTRPGFDEVIGYLIRKGEVFAPRPHFLKTTEEAPPEEKTYLIRDETMMEVEAEEGVTLESPLETPVEEAGQVSEE